MAAVSAEPPSTAPARREPPPSMVERMTLIMDAFTGRRTRLTLEDVARSTHLPRSTAHRILDQLVRLDWLDHTPFGYTLGRRALGLGSRDGDHGRLREAAAPVLHRLHLRTGMVVHLAVLDGADVFYLDKIGGRFALSVPSRVGGRALARSTALGKAILAWLEPEQVEALIAGAATRLTEMETGDLDGLHAELRQIRARRGLAFDRGQRSPGISCVAAAIRGPEGPMASISLVGDADAPLERVAPLLAAANREISLAIWPEPDRPRRQARPVRAAAAGWPPDTLNRLLVAGQNGDWL